MASRDGRARALLAGWVVAAFALSAASDARVLAAAGAAALLVFARGAGRNAARVLLTVGPVATLLALASYGWLWLAAGRAPAAAPFVAVALRALVIAFVTMSVLDRVNLLRALAPWPAATRLLVLTLAQIHALRLLATESADGLRSRLPRRPRARDVLANAGGITAALLTLSMRNAREVSDALRSRGF